MYRKAISSAAFAMILFGCQTAAIAQQRAATESYVTNALHTEASARIALGVALSNTAVAAQATANIALTNYMAALASLQVAMLESNTVAMTNWQAAVNVAMTNLQSAINAAAAAGSNYTDFVRLSITNDPHYWASLTNAAAFDAAGTAAGLVAGYLPLQGGEMSEDSYITGLLSLSFGPTAGPYRNSWTIEKTTGGALGFSYANQGSWKLPFQSFGNTRTIASTNDIAEAIAPLPTHADVTNIVAAYAAPSFPIYDYGTGSNVVFVLSNSVLYLYER